MGRFPLPSKGLASLFVLGEMHGGGGVEVFRLGAGGDHVQWMSRPLRGVGRAARERVR